MVFIIEFTLFPLRFRLFSPAAAAGSCWRHCNDGVMMVIMMSLTPLSCVCNPSSDNTTTYGTVHTHARTHTQCSSSTSSTCDWRFTTHTQHHDYICLCRTNKHTITVSNWYYDDDSSLACSCGGCVDVVVVVVAAAALRPCNTHMHVVVCKRVQFHAGNLVPRVVVRPKRCFTSITWLQLQ